MLGELLSLFGFLCALCWLDKRIEVVDDWRWK